MAHDPGFSKSGATEHNSHLTRIASILLTALALTLVTGCEPDLSKKTDAELGLNPQQAHGRHVYQSYCIQCHPAYSSSGNKGPGLKGIYKKEYLPSGLRAEDRFVEDIILHGKRMMPATHLAQDQLTDLIAYLHTL